MALVVFVQEDEDVPSVYRNLKIFCETAPRPLSKPLCAACDLVALYQRGSADKSNVKRWCHLQVKITLLSQSSVEIFERSGIN